MGNVGVAESVREWQTVRSPRLAGGHGRDRPGAVSGGSLGEGGTSVWNSEGSQDVALFGTWESCLRPYVKKELVYTLWKEHLVATVARIYNGRTDKDADTR